jgi:hypothetical protein
MRPAAGNAPEPGEVPASIRPVLDRLLPADPRDPGCGQTTGLLRVYAELAATGPSAAARRYPNAAAHLRACGACSEDLKGLLAAITCTAREPESASQAGHPRRAGSAVTVQ